LVEIDDVLKLTKKTIANKTNGKLSKDSFNLEIVSVMVAITITVTVATVIAILFVATLS
jgi:hypothetical protein